MFTKSSKSWESIWEEIVNPEHWCWKQLVDFRCYLDVESSGFIDGLYMESKRKTGMTHQLLISAIRGVMRFAKMGKIGKE